MKLESNESMSSASDNEFTPSECDGSMSPEMEPVTKRKCQKKIAKTRKTCGKERDDADDDYFRKRIR